MEKLKLLKIDKKNGYILTIIVVIILVVSLLLGLSLTIYFSQTLKRGMNDIYTSQALYLAEAGIREMIFLLSKGQNPPNPMEKNISFENGKYLGYFKVYYRLDYPNVGLITVEGEGGSPIDPSSQTNRRMIKVVVDKNLNYKIISWVEIGNEFIK